MEIMEPEVVVIADGGGVVPAVRAPVRGAELAAKLLAAAHRIEFDGELGAAVSLVVEDGRITRIYIMRNPRKLSRLDEPVELAR